MRRVAAAAVSAVVLAAAAPSALADLTPPDGATPAVGLAVVDGSLWLAGPEANAGALTNVDDGTQLTFDAQLQSVQALAAHDGRLWVGDIGDSAAARDSVTVYRINSLVDGTSDFYSYDFSYPDGAHDAQAMAISGRGRIYLVTAGENPGIYMSELEPSRQQVNRLTRALDAPAGVTDAAFLSDGSTLVLRTAEGVEVIDAWTWETKALQQIVGAPEGESLTVDGNDQLYVGGNPIIREGAVPTSNSTITLAPTESPSPEASPSVDASPSAEASEAAGPTEDTDAPAATGTMIAIAAAGVVALVAGAVAFVIRT